MIKMQKQFYEVLIQKLIRISKSKNDFLLAVHQSWPSIWLVSHRPFDLLLQPQENQFPAAAAGQNLSACLELQALHYSKYTQGTLS